MEKILSIIRKMKLIILNSVSVICYGILSLLLAKLLSHEIVAVYLISVFWGSLIGGCIASSQPIRVRFEKSIGTSRANILYFLKNYLKIHFYSLFLLIILSLMLFPSITITALLVVSARVLDNCMDTISSILEKENLRKFSRFKGSYLVLFISVIFVSVVIKNLNAGFALLNAGILCILLHYLLQNKSYFAFASSKKMDHIDFANLISPFGIILSRLPLALFGSRVEPTSLVVFSLFTQLFSISNLFATNYTLIGLSDMGKLRDIYSGKFFYHKDVWRIVNRKMINILFFNLLLVLFAVVCYYLGLGDFISNNKIDKVTLNGIFYNCILYSIPASFLPTVLFLCMGLNEFKKIFFLLCSSILISIIETYCSISYFGVISIGYGLCSGYILVFTGCLIIAINGTDWTGAKINVSGVGEE